ncbi:MAG: O-succinylhomoserine sulfhydrylase [Neisseriaceae bacterium]|nr:O-succinylhomoserine sulfhydrylase [Neisseriaceae bacterium]
MKKIHRETLAIRGERTTGAYDEHAQALYLSSSFTFDTAQEAQELFLGEKAGYTYSRTANPNVDAFAMRLAALEGAQSGIATATGMAAIQAVFMSFLQNGDHLLASKSLFGSSIGLINTLHRYGIEVDFVPQNDLSQWQNKIRSNTKILFVENVSNPLCEIADLSNLSHIANQNNALLVVDNSFCTPVVQQPLLFGAHLSVSSATKGIDGQGRVMGGAICGASELIDTIWTHIRTSGEVLSPFNAWILSSGLETLFVRMEKQCANALELAQWLQNQPQVEKVYYPFLPNFPQYELARKQQTMGGIVLSFTVVGGKDEAWKVVDNVELFSRTGNLGDVRSTITHPYTTTHARVEDKEKIACGITPNLLRLSVGLEHIDDLKNDLVRVFNLLSL